MARKLTSTTQLRPAGLLRHQLRLLRLHAKAHRRRRAGLLRDERGHGAEDTTRLLRWELGRGLAEVAVHGARGLGDVEAGLLLLLLLLEAGRLLRGELGLQTGGAGLEGLAGRVGEGGAGLLAYV